MSLIERLRERAMFQWAVAYLAAGWLTLEILEFLADNFFWPDAIVRGATITLGVGLVLVLVLAWHHGEKGRQRVGGTELLIIAALLAVGVVLVTSFAPRVAPQTDPSPSRALLPEGEERRRSVAVMPFENLTADSENAFFAEGIRESIEAQLSNIGDLRVLSRNSVMYFADSDLSVREIADELGAGAIMQGSVQRAGDEIRITARLIDPLTDDQLWADQFDGTVAELFDVQSTVAVQVAEALEAVLSPRELAAVARPLTENIDALDFYLRGQQAYQRLGPNDIEESIRLFRLAIEEDSTFAEAWSALAGGYIQRQQRYGLGMAMVDTAEALARRAIEIDSTLANGYRALGGAYFLRGQNAEAQLWFERALELNPGLQAAMGSIALTNLFTGRWDEAIRWAKRAYERDPTSTQLRELLANAYQDLQEWEIAERWLGEALEREPWSPLVRRQQQALEILRGNPDLGYDTFVTWVEESGTESAYVSTVATTGAHFARRFDDVLTWSDLAISQASGGSLRDYHDVRIARAFALSRDGLDDEAVELLADAEREYSLPVQFGADSWVFRLFLAAIHLVRGSVDEGLDWFERANERGFNGWYVIEQDPVYDIVREHPRYRAVIEEMTERLESQRQAIETEERASGERP